jgi:hypothetical protein
LTRIIIRAAPVVVGSTYSASTTAGTARLTAASAYLSGLENYWDVIADGGAHGNGSTDDTAHIHDACDYAIANGYDGVYFPAATYLLSSALTVPDGSTLVGESMNGAWLQGQLVYGSNSTFSDLRAGPASGAGSPSGLRNGSGASTTSFTRCRFRGGTITALFGSGNSATDISFTDCEFERALYTGWSGGGGSGNTISITAGDCELDGLTFTGCTIGSSNGVASGSERFGAECWTAPDLSGWWRNLTFTGCTFEPSKAANLDLACYGPDSPTYAPGSVRGTNVLVEDCYFKGGTPGGDYSYCICIEGPDIVTITGNTFYRSQHVALDMLYYGYPATEEDSFTITDNLFDWDTDYAGVVLDGSGEDGPMIMCSVSYAQITGNTLRYSGTGLNTWAGFLGFNGSTYEGGSGGQNNIATGNTFEHSSSWSDSNLIKNVNGASGNSTISSNTLVHI